MKILLCYFSGTGNTKRVTELYKSALSERGHEVTEIELPNDNISSHDINSYDLIGIGYPIHGFNAPKIILKLCKSLPKRDKKTAGVKSVFVYKTSGEPVRMSDVSSLKMRKILKRRGYIVNNEYQYVMPYNIIFRHSDKAVYKMWQTAKALVPADVEELLSGKTSLPKKMFMGGFLAWVLRAEHWGAHILGKLFKPSKDCVKCGKCVKMCPAGNIKVKKNGKIKFGGKCMICMRCSMYCPKNAVKLGLLRGWRVNGAYSFEPPSEESAAAPDKHEHYCEKAYARYYKNAEQKIAEYEKNNNI